jgi:hypothetical protein
VALYAQGRGAGRPGSLDAFSISDNVLYRTSAPARVSFSKVDFRGLPKSSATVRRGRDQAGGCARPADGGPFLFEGPVATEPKVRFGRSPRLGGFLRPASTTADLGGERTDWPQLPSTELRRGGHPVGAARASKTDLTRLGRHEVGGLPPGGWHPLPPFPLHPKLVFSPGLMLLLAPRMLHSTNNGPQGGPRRRRPWMIP